MKIVVREASLEDAPLIAELTRKAWADKCPPISGGHHDTWQKVNEDLHAGGAFILMADIFRPARCDGRRWMKMTISGKSVGLASYPPFADKISPSI